MTRSVSLNVMGGESDKRPDYVQPGRKPSWLRVKLPAGPAYGALRKTIDDHKLHTVCESAKCPNMGECWARGTATVMILGNVCTRSCGFCNIATGRPPVLDLDEPRRVADAIALMKLKHCVITSVNRDELEDGGAGIWAETITRVREMNPGTSIEVSNSGFLRGLGRAAEGARCEAGYFESQHRDGAVEV